MKYSKISVTFGLLFISVAASVVMSSCSKERIKVDPRQSIPSSTALTKKINVDAAVNSVYSAMKSTALYGRDLLAVADALSDITRATNRSGRLVAENNNNFRAHLAFWGTAYSAINEINLILDAAPSVADASQADKDSWDGQLRFLRGLLYFNLVRTYSYMPTAIVTAKDKGGVPIRLVGTNNPDSAIKYAPSRASINAVYDQIYTDLNVAITKLTNSRGVAYATRAGARALLSRVALYRGDWTTCIQQSTSAQSEGLGVLVNAGNYVNAWRQGVHPESIFEIRFQSNQENIGVNTSLQTSYTSLVTPGNSCSLGGFGDLVPNSFLLGQLGITTGASPTCGASPVPGVITRGSDVRAQLYEWGALGRGTPNVECTKFLGKSGQINLDNVPVIRFSELLLNRAEAYYMSGGAGNETLALADLNTLRTNRGLTTVTLSGQALFDEIIRQRMLEFAFEGHRFFDLKRLGRDIVKSPSNIVFTDDRILAPIPQGEIDGNPNMAQNNGY
jgi:starch-binding outer membrane protein, SusD/RagB family